MSYSHGSQESSETLQHVPYTPFAPSSNTPFFKVHRVSFKEFHENGRFLERGLDFFLTERRARYKEADPPDTSALPERPSWRSVRETR